MRIWRGSWPGRGVGAKCSDGVMASEVGVFEGFRQWLVGACIVAGYFGKVYLGQRIVVLCSVVVAVNSTD